MRLSSLVALVLLGIGAMQVGCRTTNVEPVLSVPPDATTVILTDDEMPRVIYAEAWGAFAQFGWEVVDANSAALQLTVRPEGYSTGLDLYVEEDVVGGRVSTGRLVATVDPEAPAARDVLVGATRALATIPGRISFR